MIFDFLGHSIDHGNRKHLCVELSDEQFNDVQAKIDRLKSRYHFTLKEAILHCINEGIKELNLEEASLAKMGKKIF